MGLRRYIVLVATWCYNWPDHGKDERMESLTCGKWSYSQAQPPITEHSAVSRWRSPMGKSHRCMFARRLLDLFVSRSANNAWGSNVNEMWTKQDVLIWRAASSILLKSKEHIEMPIRLHPLDGSTPGPLSSWHSSPALHYDIIIGKMNAS